MFSNSIITTLVHGQTFLILYQSLTKMGSIINNCSTAAKASCYLGYALLLISCSQSQFDELWTKFSIYSAGEQLFGLAVTEYPTLGRIKKELNLLQKLYGLYGNVMTSINGYFDILWTEVDIEKINQELSDLQNR